MDYRGSGECPGEPELIWDGRELDWISPGEVRAYLRGVGKRYLLNKYYEEGWRKLLEEYSPPKKYMLGLIIPCSYGKPYSQSFIHYFIRRTLADYLREQKIHEIIVTNAGVVPRELDEHWPYTAYDWNPKYETPGIKECYKKVLARRLKGYIEKHRSRYRAFAAYLRWDSDSWSAVKKVSEEMGIPIPNLAPSAVAEEDIREISLHGLYDDPDLILVTRTALNHLRESVRKLLE